MKPRLYIFLLLFSTIAFYAYSSDAADNGVATVAGAQDITARGAIGQLEAAVSAPVHRERKRQ
jgi:hypothetical protein